MLDAVRNGATLTPAATTAHTPYWKLIKADGPEPWGGRHSIFVDVWDEQGHRMVGVPVEFFWLDGSEIKRTEAKTGEPWAVDFPMYAAGRSYGVRMDSFMASDELFGMGLLANGPHVVYKLIFQRTVASSAEPPPAPIPTPTRDKIQLIVNGTVVYSNE